ncbi:hypothetical protein BGZ46_000844 [Entomortierella lignicola]|nr:hypothetical protein BGZ46_000844 [Entomortierella lignicola]
MEILETKKIEVLGANPSCTYKTCRKDNPSRQHSSRRHSGSPYLRRFNGRVARFTRAGKEGDEERPFQCCCGKEYQNTRSLADHLSNGSADSPTVKGVRNKSSEGNRSSSPSDNSDIENSLGNEETSEVTYEQDPALIAHVMDLEVRLRIMERTVKQFEQTMSNVINQGWYGSGGEYRGYCQGNNSYSSMPMSNPGGGGGGWHYESRGSGGALIPGVLPLPPLPPLLQQQQQQQQGNVYGLPSLPVLYPNSNVVQYQSWYP